MLTYLAAWCLWAPLVIGFVVFVPVDVERARLVFPGNAVVVEDPRALELRLIGESRRSAATIRLEIQRFRGHPFAKVATSPDAA